MLDNKLLVCRTFDKYDDTHRVIELALPVEVCECSAYRVAERELDPLAYAVLELMNIDIVSDNEISKTLDISTDLVKLIKQSILFTHSYISNDYKTLSNEGKKYLLDGQSSEYQTEKVFGNMFVSIPDGEVMPYFLEGTTSNRYFPREICKLITVNDDRDIVKDHVKWLPKFAKAYKLFAKIYKHSDTEGTNELEFANVDFDDVPFEEVNETEDQIITLADAEAKNESLPSSFQLVKLLHTEKRQTYIKTKIVISRENPESFAVISPFEKNITNWYTKRLAWLRENNVKIIDEIGKEKTVKEFLEEITMEFYIQFPELQAENFDYWLSITYPNLKTLKCQKYLMDSFKSLHNINTLYNNSQVEATAVVIKTQRLIETILNNFIERIPYKSAILTKCKLFATKNSNKVKEIFSYFGIIDCVVLRYEKWRESLRNLSRLNSKYGSSVADKYFYLTIDAYFSEYSPFKTILEKNAVSFIEKIDYLNRIRNKYGAHSDKKIKKDVSKEEIEHFNKIATEVINELINTLFEEEQFHANC
jgi:hypothetical protein